MNFNKFLKSIFGDKSKRDMRLIQPLVEKVKEVSPEIEKLTNDELRAKSKEIQKYVQDAATPFKEKINELRAKIEDTPIDEREPIFNEIDKQDKDMLEALEKALNEVMPTAFAIVKDTARRFSQNADTVVTATDFDRELAANPKNDFITIDGDKAIYHNEWTAGGNKIHWDMVHYDVQLFGGIALHQGKIAEMATGEGKTLVATLPVFLNALTGNGVHMVTVNDYLAKRDSEWMGPLYEFHGLSVDCIDKHQPNSQERRKAYQADITFGTNNEFGFDYLRDNMALSPDDLVQRRHNFAIVDEVDSVLIDDARTPLIISGPVPKGENQMFEEYQPLVERLYEVQRKQATELLADARQKINAGRQETDKNKAQQLLDEGFLSLYRSFKALPKNKALIKYLSEEGIKSGMQKTEEIYMENNNRRMPEAVKPLYFVVDEKMNSADLTDKGVDWLTNQVHDKDLFVLPDIASELSALENEKGLSDQERLDKKDSLLQHFAVQSERVHTLQQLLKAYTMFNKDDEYVVIDGEVKIVDEQTGRIMEGRRWSDGLHQAIEAKEHVRVQSENKTLATITFQNYFRLYGKLSGMTGTAMTEEEEFAAIYNLDIIEIPTNKPVIRIDNPDVVYKNEAGKLRAIIEQIRVCHEKGQPVLVGTVSIEKSEHLSKLLRKAGVPHNVLNAKHHEKEAEIVAQAGKFGAVTIATNMAGRGTDIMLGGNAEYLAKADLRKAGFSEEVIAEATGYAETENEEILKARALFAERMAEHKKSIDAEADRVRAAGGLYIIGTERHESRRIDNQLRGRSGRQGDPGESRFYIALTDDVMRLFGSERMQSMMETLRVDEDTPLDHKMLSNAIEQAQRTVESRNFQARKNVLEYDDVMNVQRNVIYEERRKVLDGEDLQEHVQHMIRTVITGDIAAGMAEHHPENDKDLHEILAPLEKLFPCDLSYTAEELHKLTPDTLSDAVYDCAMKAYAAREEAFGLQPDGTPLMRELERVVMLRVVDEYWMDHLEAMDDLRQGIGLRAYGNVKPVDEYKRAGFDMFDEMVNGIQSETVRRLFTVRVRREQKLERKTVARSAATNAGGDDSEKKRPVRRVKKPGRNDPCPCGKLRPNGLPMKYKDCCGKNA